jgi:hypothetical protein
MKDERHDAVCSEPPEAYVRAALRWRREYIESLKKRSRENARAAAMEMFADFMPGEAGVTKAIEVADGIVDALFETPTNLER